MHPLRAIVERLRGCRVAVIGDVTLNEYLRGDVTQIPIIVDPQQRSFATYRGATVITTQAVELASIAAAITVSKRGTSTVSPTELATAIDAIPG